MSFSPEIAADVLAACRANVVEIGEALSRSLDGAFEVRVDDAGTYSAADVAEDWNGPGLVLVLKTESSAALAMIAESSGLLPPWYQRPDAGGVAKLTTLAQELGIKLLPEAHAPVDFAAAAVENLAAAVKRSEASDGAGLISLTLTSGEKSGQLHLLWPAPLAEAALDVPKVASRSGSSEEQAEDEEAARLDEETEARLRALPPYIRSLLKIRVPVSVVLATTKQPLNRIVEIGPGAIIPFEKSCEQSLTLFVGNHAVAEGDAVKCGEMFGLRVTGMILPGERFVSIGLNRAAG